MGLRINTNVASLSAQNKLAATTKRLNQSLTRLSTGLRINTGKDDVVGLAQSETLISKIRGGNVARTNMASANAKFAIAEGGLSQATEIAQNIRDLAVQAASEDVAGSDRQALIDSLNQQMSEYNRLVNNLNVNGVKMLDGTFNYDVQVGSDEGNMINVSIADARSATIGKIASLSIASRSAVSTTASTTALNMPDFSTVSIAGVTVGSSAFTDDGVSNTEGDESAIAYVNAINQYAGETGVTATVLSNSRTFTYTSGANLTSALNLIVNGVTIKDSTTIYQSTDTGVADLVLLINQYSSETGVVATQNSAADALVLTASDGRNIDVVVGGTASSTTTVSKNVFGMTGGSANKAAAFRGSFKLTSNERFTVTDSTSAFATSATTSVALDDNTTLDNVSFDTAADAGTALAIMDKVIEQLSARRSTVGSTSNRLDIADAELASRIENLSAANSAIRDADVASETAKYTQASILQQAGATVLAQANSAPQIALTLLQSI